MTLKKNSQFELFPGAAPPRVERSRFSDLFKDLTLSLENIILLVIIFIMTLVVTFSLGVEKGKQLILRRPTDIRIEDRTLDRQSGRIAASGQRSIQRIPASPVEPAAMPAPREPVISGNPPAENQKVLEIPIEKKKLLEQLYTIQVASFKSQKSAEQEAEALRKKGFDIFILPKGEHMIVCVGKFNEKIQAQQFSNKLKNKYNDCLVRRL